MDKNDELKEIGERISMVRKEKGMSQKELSHAVNRDPQSIQRLEAGNVNPSYYFLVEVANGLGVELREILS